jgi:hypothetical protein
VPDGTEAAPDLAATVEALHAEVERLRELVAAYENGAELGGVTP